MNRLFLLAPKTVLNKYVFDHFGDLSVEDFLSIRKRVEIPSDYFSTHKNDVLKQNSEVLSCMLDKDIEVFRNFDAEAFSQECIDKLASGNVKIKEEDLEKYPMLLENKKMCESMIRENPTLVKKMKDSQITHRIVSLLAESGYVPDEEDFLRCPSFAQNEGFVRKGIENHPNVILQIPNLSVDNVTTAIRNGFVPKKEHFYSYPHLKKFNQLLIRAFESDPSMIRIFDKEHLSSTYVVEASKRGYIADEMDLIENPDLTKYPCIMEPVIKRNPKLIVYLSASCPIHPMVIKEALQNYQITKQDLERFPNLAGNESIMCHLPQFRLYSMHLTEKEKQKALEDVIKRRQNVTMDALPFLDYRFGAKADIKKLNKLIQCLEISVDEENMDEQQRYFQILDKVIDGIVNIRYAQNSSSFLYTDIVSLHNNLMSILQKMSITQNPNYADAFVVNLHTFVGKRISREYLYKEIMQFYQMYLEGQDVDLPVTSAFFNFVLNEHRNDFSNKEKRAILKDVEGKMTLSQKKVNTIWNGRKLKEVAYRIQRRQWNSLGITEAQFHEMIQNTEEEILNNKDVKKSGMDIKKADLDLLAIPFSVNGALTLDLVQSILNGQNIEVMKFIVHKFEQMKFKLISNITLSEEQREISNLEKEKLGGLNHKDYTIIEKNRYVKNLASLLLKLEDRTVNKILEKEEIIHEVAYFLPLLDLIHEFSVDTFLNILSNYNRVRYKIVKEKDSSLKIDYSNLILKKIEDVIVLANAYSSIDNITLLALGENIVSCVGEQNSKQYLNFYLKIIDRLMGSIPPVCIQMEDYSIESGFYSDPERLLIGKKIADTSCIDLLNLSGVSTYVETLSLRSGDVALFKDFQNNLLSRVLIFRRGNFIQMVTRFSDKTSIEVYKKIAEEMMEQAIVMQDNLDYIFINADNKNLDERGYITVQDPRFKSSFPHADTCVSAILLSSRENVQNSSAIRLDFDVLEKKSYMKLRKQISYQPTEEEITRLRALSIVMEKDVVERENKARDFDPFYKEEYREVYCGEDWYIAIREDGSLEELALPLQDPRIYEEMEYIKKNLHLKGNKTL